MKINVIEARNTTSKSCIDILTDKIVALEEQPNFIALHHNVCCSVEELRAKILPHCNALHFASSCLGTMGQFGHQTDSYGIAAFCIFDPDGDYASAMTAFGDGTSLSPFEAARKATLDALERAGRPGEAPALIWISATPGQEEDALKGVHDIVGHNVAIVGGSAADNDISAQWSVGDAHSHAKTGVTISVLFPSTEIAVGYQNGYVPTDKSGVITKAKARQIIEIDHRPAMDVYEEWTKGAITRPSAQDGMQMILSKSATWPIGQLMGETNGVSNYLLAHPSNAHPTGEIDLFAEIPEGNRVTQMTGDPDILAVRAGRVAQQVRLSQRNGKNQEIAGALIVYCAGCMLAVRSQIDRVVSGINRALDDAPFLGVFTFGEQGPMLNHGNRHGNLMIACVIFSAN